LKTTLLSLTTFLLSLGACLVYLNANGQSAAGQIKQLEKRRFEAQMTKDGKTLGEILADDLVYTHSNGNQDGKASYIESIVSGKAVYQNIEVLTDTVRFYGPTTAIVTGKLRTSVVTNGQTNPLTLRYTDVYLKRNGQWQMVAWQSARLAN
jgi:uncharacterized protein (TIGR02246 family)